MFSSLAISGLQNGSQSRVKEVAEKGVTGNPFDSALSGPDYHHTPGRHRSHGVMDHLLGRSRDHDDKSGIIGSRSQRADLGATKSGSTKSKGPGFASDEQNYSFETPARSREDPRRSAIDAVPRVSALDSEEAMGHEFSSKKHPYYSEKQYNNNSKPHLRPLRLY
ncbi:uncharacterized protein PG998_004774 [Apiospora kogelbergensis]|uniref:uncharacterized protein n=1 Tax=Apiospora kogelbergensis TaxID=1337665 RepID=UPI0031302DB9